MTTGQIKDEYNYYLCEKMYRDDTKGTWLVKSGVWQTRPDNVVMELNEEEYKRMSVLLNRRD